MTLSPKARAIGDRPAFPPVPSMHGDLYHGMTYREWLIGQAFGADPERPLAALGSVNKLLELLAKEESP